MHRSLRFPALPILLLGLVALGAACENDAFNEEVAETRPLPPRGHAWVVFEAADTVVAEVAETPQARERGLMFREEVPDGTGMIFVFDDADIRSFWMRDTYVPLDIAFLDPAQRIVDIQQMEPESEEFTESAAPAMFALEVRQGWFEEQGIQVGDQVRIVFGRR
jgi:uncharacterized protein